MLISFILTYHNEPVHFLEECVRSILALPLTEEEYEVMVVDDGSDTSPAEFLSTISKRIVCVSQNCSGLSAARNHGIGLAQGEYIQFVDCDDSLIPNSYTNIVRLMKEGVYDIIQFDFKRGEQLSDCRLDHTPENPTKDDHTNITFNGTSVEYMLQHNIHATAWGYAVRRKCLGNLRFEEGILHEDELFTPLLFAKNLKMSVVKMPAYFYRISPAGITMDRKATHIAKRLNDIHYVLNILKEASVLNQGMAVEALKRRVAQLTMDYTYHLYKSTDSVASFLKQVRLLREEGLMPLPIRHYTFKYLMFSIISRLLCL